MQKCARLAPEMAPQKKHEIFAFANYRSFIAARPRASDRVDPIILAAPMTTPALQMFVVHIKNDLTARRYFGVGNVVPLELTAV